MTPKRKPKETRVVNKWKPINLVVNGVSIPSKYQPDGPGLWLCSSESYPEGVKVQHVDKRRSYKLYFTGHWWGTFAVEAAKEER